VIRHRRSEDGSRPRSEQSALSRPGAADKRRASCSERDGMCPMPCGRSVVVPPPALRQVRPHWLLRYVAEPARDCALPRDRPLRHHELRARRGLVLELPHRKTVLWPQAGATAVAASGSACPWTKGACPGGLGRLSQRISNRFATRPARNEVHGRRNRCITKWSRDAHSP
jgi:hypothetical protein